MTEGKWVKAAFVGVKIPSDWKNFAKEYEIDFIEIATTGTDLRRDLQKYHPQLLVVDNKFLSNVYANVPKEDRPTIFVAAEENSEHFPMAVDAGVADDAILLPLRKWDFLSKLRLHQHIFSLRSVEGLNSSITKLIHKVEEDIVFAQKIQRRLIKDRFPPMSGISVKSKYWCGLRSGGDYFDIFEFSDKNHIGFLFSDVTSYGLSSAMISALMHIPLSSTVDELQSPLFLVKKIFAELKESMEEKDNISLFYGVLDRKSYLLKYVYFGNTAVVLRTASGKLQWLNRGNMPSLGLQNDSTLQNSNIAEIPLEPEDRLMLFSDGWEETLACKIPKFLETIEDRDPQSVINEFAFALKEKQDPEGKEALEGETPMPPQDCSLMLIDVSKNILRLAR